MSLVYYRVDKHFMQNTQLKYKHCATHYVRSADECVVLEDI